MADSILRLKVDSQEYDQKIKRASEGIQKYATECKKAGGTLTQLDDGVEEFVKALGQMDTVSRSTKGSINEMTKAFTDLSVQYNRLTEEEKQSPFGRALSSSLEQLKGRIQSGNTEIKDITNSLSGGGGLRESLESLAGKMGINVTALTKFGGGLAAASAALKVAKDAFFQSESNIDEWGRTLKGAEGAYDVFLQTLNNGNWSNFFNNLSQAIRGARDLYDAFDRLNSIKFNNSVAIATTQAEIQRLRLLKQQGQDVDAQIKAATQRLSKLQSQSTSAGINAGKSQVVNTLRNGVNSIGGASINNATLNRAADNIAKQGQAYFDFMKKRTAALEKKGMVTKTRTLSDSQGNVSEQKYQVFDINALSKEQQKQYAIAKTVTERETEIQKGLTVWSQAVNEKTANTREQFRDNRYALQGSGGGSTGSNGSGKGGTTTEQDTFTEIIGLIPTAEEEVKSLQEQIRQSWDEGEIAALNEKLEKAIANLQRLKNLKEETSDVKLEKEIFGDTAETSTGEGDTSMGAAMVSGLSTSLSEAADNLDLTGFAQRIQEAITEDAGDMDLSEYFENLKESISEYIDEDEWPSIKLAVETGDFKALDGFMKKMNKDASGTEKSMMAAANSIGSVGSALQQIQDPAAKVVGIVMQAIATVVQGYASASLQASQMGPWAWLAFAATGLATMVTTISQIHSVTGYATGGEIKGNKYSGDQIPIMANAGEIVLTSAQAGNLASQLEGGGLQGLQLETRISGEDIRLVLNNNGRRTGKGEFVQSQNYG